MKLSSYLYNLFMTIVILLFLFIAYLFYKVNKVYKEAFEDSSDDQVIVNGIDVTNLDPNTTDINSLNLKPININPSLNDLNKLRTLAKSTDGETDIMTNNKTQCKIYKKQVDTLTENLEKYRFQDDFENLRISYNLVESLTEKMNNLGCK